MRPMKSITTILPSRRALAAAAILAGLARPASGSCAAGAYEYVAE